MKFQLEKNFEKVSFLKTTQGDRWGLVWGGDGDTPQTKSD